MKGIKVCVFAILCVSWAEFPADAGQLAWWTMNEGVGASTIDIVNSHTGTVQGATWTMDRFGYSGNALECGVSKWIDIPDSIKPTNITLCAWIFITGYDSSAAPIFSSEMGSGASGFAWRLQVRSNKHLGFEAIAPFGSSGSRGVESSEVLSTGLWYHVAGTYDGRSSLLYLNGELIASNTYATVQNLNTGTSIPSAIGHLQNWGVQWFRGTIDDARIFDCPLLFSEIEKLASDQPEFNGVSLQENAACLAIGNIPPGITNTVLVCSDLVIPYWSTAGVFCAESDTTNWVHDTEAAGARFYRIQTK